MQDAVEQLKKTLEDVCRAADAAETIVFPKEYRNKPNRWTLRKYIQLELLRFLAYLSKSDGVIDRRELDFIKNYLNIDFTADELNTFIKNSNIDSEDYKNTVPQSLRALVDADNIMSSRGNEKTVAAVCLYIIYECTGKLFIACDSKNNDDEVHNFAEYLLMLKDFIGSECTAYDVDDEIDYIKNKKNITPENSAEADESPKKDDDEETLEELLKELNSLTGLQEVKKDVNSLINLLQIRKIREQRGMKTIPMSMHLVFSGNPGTGKTTVARLLAKIYCRLGVLSKGHLVEVDRSGLVGGYVGQTAIKVQDVIQKSLGGILFIDEAYSLAANKGADDFGIEAVDTLLKGMEDNRDNLVVIAAGYPDLMTKFLDSNPGLRSRFNKFINFSDYTPDELCSIFKGMCIKSGYSVSENCLAYIKEYFENRLETCTNFANGRDVRNFFEAVMINQANRLVYDNDITDEELMEFTMDDIKGAAV